MIAAGSSRRARPSAKRTRDAVEELPWGTLRASELPESVLMEAQRSFAEGAESERMTAVGFAELAGALARAAAPAELVERAAQFVGEEMVHAEINERLARELGAEPATREVSSFGVDTSLSAFDQALELAVRVSCVGEALSVPLLGLSAKSATHPLVRGALRIIAREEPPHAELGLAVLAWARDGLDGARLERLRASTLRELARFADYFAPRASTRPEHVRALSDVGFAPPEEYERVVVRALADRVIAPLAALGIDVAGRPGA